jgi:hypothetical protein
VNAPSFPDAASASARLVVDGNSTDLADGQTLSLPSGVDILRTGNVYVVTDQSGNSIRAVANPTWIDVSVGLGTSPTTVRGLLANPNGNVNELATSDGTVLTSPVSFEDLYHRYGESWRVGPADSLLADCGGGTVEQGTPSKPFYASDLDPEIQQRARAICTQADVTQPALLDACTLDVAVLGTDQAATVYAGAPSPTAVLPRPKSATTTTLSSSANPSAFGAPATFTATVTASSPGSGTPSGTVTFSRGSIVLGTASVDTTGRASLTTSGLQAGTSSITANYSGDGNFLASTSAPLAQVVACGRTISGLVGGPLNVTNSTCLSNAFVVGSVAVRPGAALSVSNSTIMANLASTGAAALSVCGSGVMGLTTISGTTGFVLVGDNGDDGQPGCTGNRFIGAVTLDHNAGQAEIGGNNFLAQLTVTNTSGTGPDTETTTTEIEHNTVTGVLNCGGNVPAPTNDGQPNSVLGLRLGQCSALAF